MANPDETKYIRNPAVTETNLDDDVFLVEPGSGEVFYLNLITSGLWTLFAEAASTDEALAIYRSAFPDNPEEDIRRDVTAAIVEMRDRDLIVAYRD